MSDTSPPNELDATEVEFARKVAELTPKLGTSEMWEGVYGLRAVEEAWARHLLGVGDGERLHRLVQARVERGFDPNDHIEMAERALVHLREAEQHQWAIGSTATGSGEGLASMGAVHMLQTAQAWLEAGIARARFGRARQLAATVEHAHNGLGAYFKKSLADLEKFIVQRDSPAGATP